MAAPARLIRALIVDDAPGVRLLMRHILRASGLFAVVGEATDGHQAIEVATAEQPDVIFLDLEMPVMDGLAAIPVLAGCSPGSIIIVLSGFSAQSAAQQALAIGAHAYIEKKHRPDELLRKIVEIVRTVEFPGGDRLASALSGIGAIGPLCFEAEARASANQFRLVFEHAPIGTAFVGLDGRLLEVNHAFCRLTGYPEADLIGRRLDDLVDPEDIDSDTALLSELLAGGIVSYVAEKRLTRADGTSVALTFSRSLLVDDVGWPRLVVTQATDVSEQKRGQAALGLAHSRLASSEARYRAIVEAAGDALVAFDANGAVADWNPKAESLFGWPEREAVGRRLEPPIIPAIEVAEAAQPSRRTEAMARHRDGHHFPVEYVAWRSLGPEPKLNVFVHDVAERRATGDGSGVAARELAMTNAEVFGSNNDLSDFAAVAAHDLKSPLHIVLGFSGLLASTYGDRLEEGGRALVASIIAGAQRMEELIDDLLLYCRLGSATRMFTSVDLPSVFAASSAILGPEIESRSAEVSSGPLPSVTGDPVQLQNLMVNLMENALKFSIQGSVPQIRVEADRLEAGWRLSVSDKGIGIDPSKRERIFKMFARLHPQDQYGGTGIGLASCQRIVEGHGGRIWVEENPGGGSRFLVTIPDATPAPHTGQPGSELAPTLADRPIEVLLVEDSPEHAKLIAALLAQAPQPGYHLRHAGSIVEALDVLTTAELDCVLLDLTLPDASDLEAVAQVRSAAPLLPVVVTTSSSDEALALAAVREGAQDYLVKGHINAEHLSRSIQWAVQRKALETEMARDALHDALTGLPNRTLMLDRLRSALARTERSGTTVAVFFLDLDGFKPVNDRFGHDAGDRVLIAVAERLRSALRPQDTVARIGGDEFVVISEGFGAADQEWDLITRRLAATIATPIMIDGQAVQVTASIGWSVGGSERDPEALLREADIAMYRSKRAHS